tara:strand:- start:1151 stop:1264 length:114 start_codon:yes stop_codon:yes gene_type:complete
MATNHSNKKPDNLIKTRELFDPAMRKGGAAMYISNAR